MESASPSAQGGKGRKLGLAEIRQLADEPWAPVAQGHTGAEVVRSVRVALRGTNVHVDRAPPARSLKFETDRRGLRSNILFVAVF